MADPRFTSLKELRELMDVDYVNSRKINCIKTLRQITGEGLKETKDFFEQEWLPFINGERKTFSSKMDPLKQQALEDRVAKLEQTVANLQRQIQPRMQASDIFSEGE